MHLEILHACYSPATVVSKRCGIYQGSDLSWAATYMTYYVILQTCEVWTSCNVRPLHWLMYVMLYIHSSKEKILTYQQTECSIIILPLMQGPPLLPPPPPPRLLTPAEYLQVARHTTTLGSMHASTVIKPSPAYRPRPSWVSRPPTSVSQSKT